MARHTVHLHNRRLNHYYNLYLVALLVQTPTAQKGYAMNSCPVFLAESLMNLNSLQFILLNEVSALWVNPY